MKFAFGLLLFLCVYFTFVAFVFEELVPSLFRLGLIGLPLSYFIMTFPIIILAGYFIDKERK